MQKVRAEINLQHIRHNAEAFLDLTKTKLCAVVKANAYGHGAEAVTAALCGVADSFAVALLEEALAIRVAACGKTRRRIAAGQRNAFDFQLYARYARRAERKCADAD